MQQAADWRIAARRARDQEGYAAAATAKCRWEHGLVLDLLTDVTACGKTTGGRAAPYSELLLESGMLLT